jgi:AraC-like DNA-binding protein
MDYQQIRASAAVSEYVEFYWILEDRSPTGCIQRIVPDGRPALILNFARPFLSHRNGAWLPQPDCFLVGQITEPLLLRPSGPAAMLGIQFRPHGAAELLRLPISELTNSAVALEDLSKQLFRQLECLQDLSSLTKAATALDSILHRIAEQARRGEDRISYVVRTIERTCGLVSIAQVADRVGWSARQLQRRFRSAVGISPKLFGRMRRFQEVLRAMESPGSNWVNAAVRCGYFDQAHLIRDFREFTGKTPTALLDQEIELVRRFLQPPAMSHFSKTAGARSG